MPINADSTNSVNAGELMPKIMAARKTIVQILIDSESNGLKPLDLASVLEPVFGYSGLNSQIHKKTDSNQSEYGPPHKYGNLYVPLNDDYTLEVELPMGPGVERLVLGFLNTNGYDNDSL